MIVDTQTRERRTDGPRSPAAATASPAAPSRADAADTPADPGRLTRLSAAVDQLLACPPDELDEPALKAELSSLETEVRRLSARQTRIVAAMTRRRASAAAQRKGTDEHRERERAARDVQQELTDEHQWTPSQAKAAGKLGRQLTDRPRVADAYDRGDLPPRNAQLLGDLLDKLPLDRHDRVLERLLPAGRRQDAVSFGRSCRQVLAELDHDTAMRDEDRRHDSRRAAVTQRPDGMTVLSGQWSGIDGELLHTVVHAFRTPDGPGVHRSAEQRTADAIIEAFRVALRAGEAPAQHGIRPHLMITVSQSDLTAGKGSAEGTWTGPIPVGEVEHLLGDASVSRVLVDAKGLPLEASAEVRTVPIGLYRFLLIRDGGCIAESCDAPATWCDVMHLSKAYRHDGRLSPDNAALGCRRHHRSFDRQGWQLTWEDGRPILRPPRRRPTAGP